MKVKQLAKKLAMLRIPADAYSLSGGLPSECYCLSHNTQWEVYYSERGLKTQLKIFDSEEEACEFFYKMITAEFST